MTQAEQQLAVTGPILQAGPGGPGPLSVELRHLRYFVAVADAGTFTHAAQRMYIAQPTLSQQIRRLEEIVGTPLLHRQREGVRLTAAGTVLLEESRTVLSQVDHGMSRTRQAAGLGRLRLRVVIPPDLPESPTVETASRLRSAADAAGAGIAWLEIRADAGLGWLTTADEAMPAPLEVMSLGEFAPEVWIPSSHPAALQGTIGLDELASMNVIHGPRRASAETYDAWLTVLRTADPRFDFTDPPFRHSLPITLAFAATASTLTAVLTGPRHAIGTRGLTEPDPVAGTCGMVRVRLDHCPLAATAGLAWSDDLPRQLQQVLFDTADGITF